MSSVLLRVRTVELLALLWLLFPRMQTHFTPSFFEVFSIDLFWGDVMEFLSCNEALDWV